MSHQIPWAARFTPVVPRGKPHIKHIVGGPVGKAGAILLCYSLGLTENHKKNQVRAR